MIYSKKPEVIEAIQWKGDNFKEVLEFQGKDIVSNPDKTLTISTIEGQYTVNINDWVIKGVKDRVYACKPDIFEQTYELMK